MKQAIIKKGKVFSDEIPAPKVSKGMVLIKVERSCISAGTEVSGVIDTGKSILEMGIEEPSNIKKGMNLLIEKGIIDTIKFLRNMLNAPRSTGYSISGVIVDVGKEIKNFAVGDRVAAAGAGYANHAEYVSVPENLVVKIPNGLDFTKASTVTLGAIALQGVRRANLKLGESAVVYGTGILGLLTIQLLKISGIRVAAIDLEERRLAIAKKLGAEITINASKENVIENIDQWSGGVGVDGVLFTAATKNSEPLSKSFRNF